MKQPLGRSPLAIGAAALTLALALTGCAEEIESPKVTIDHLEPDLICNAQFPAGGRVVALIGDNLTPTAKHILEGPVEYELPSVVLTRTAALDGGAGNGLTLTLSGERTGENFDHLGWESEERMTLRFDDALVPEPGVYSVTVTNPDGHTSDTREIGLAVVPPPEITGHVPRTLCNGFQDQELTVGGANFLRIGDAFPTVTLVSVDGGERFDFAATGVGGCVTIGGLSQPVELCTEVTAVVPANTLAGGMYDIVVTNPAPADCATPEPPGAGAPARIRVLEEGPVLFYADPPVVYNGINTKETLFMTAVTGDFDVTIVPDGQTNGQALPDAQLVAGTSNRIQATIPSGTAPDVYDIIVEDETGCSAVLDKGVRVTADLKIDLDGAIPPFGQTGETTAIGVFRAGGTAFSATPRAFLNPADAGPGDIAIQLASVTLVTGDELGALVPRSTPVGVYDLVVVNPSGEVGLLEDAYESLADPAPVITDIVPQSVVNQSGQAISVRGTGFRDVAVTARCRQAATGDIVDAAVTSADESCAGGTCSVQATVDGSALSPGDVCVVTITNADGSYADYSAIGITNSSFNLSAPQPGPTLADPRRALTSTAVKATSASRFVYAIGGDGGEGTAPYASVEVAPVSIFGEMRPFFDVGEPMNEARAFHGGAQIGRYIYVFGGRDGAGGLDSAERAVVLSPEEVPSIDDLDLCLHGGRNPCFADDTLGDGLGAGEYAYRVAAVIAGDDAQNPGGETLASDPLILKLPLVQNRGILVELMWSPPRDVNDQPLTGIVGWRIYRTPIDGVAGRDEVLLAVLDDAGADRFIDDGTRSLGSERPLPLGATSAWQPLPALRTPRIAPAAAAAPDPQDPGTWYLYALLGEGLDSYELLKIDVLDNGHQTVAAGWTAGSEKSGSARAQAGAWVVDHLVAEAVTAPDVFIYLGGGLAADGQDGRVEAARVQTGGQLTAFADADGPGSQDAVTDFSATRVGYGTAAAANRLFLFGGMASGETDKAKAARIQGAPGLANNAWNDEGLRMTVPRYLLGSSIQSAFIFLLGGETDAAAAAVSTESVVW